MFWSKNKKKIYPCKPQFYYIKVGCKGVFFTQTCFRDDFYLSDLLKLAGNDDMHSILASSNFGKIRRVNCPWAS